ncbi:hypothetical protein Q3G72_018878 [Acer saccharum]|nr:hypothetical protein Q3G72_018878 [Acer saccharum]
MPMQDEENSSSTLLGVKQGIEQTLKNYKALEAENAAIRATNEELRALVDGVVPDSVTSERPILANNGEQIIDRIAPRPQGNPNVPNTNPDDQQNQPTPQKNRVKIDLNNMPARNEMLNEQDPAMD